MERFTNEVAEFDIWVYPDDDEQETYAVNTDLAGYSQFTFIFASREDRNAFFALLKRVKELEVD